MWKSAGRAPSLQVLPWHFPYNWGKSTNLSQCKKNLSQVKKNLRVQYTHYQNTHPYTHTHTHTHTHTAFNGECCIDCAFFPHKSTIDAALAVKSFTGKTYKRTVFLWWDWMSKEHLTPLGGHAYLAIYGTYDVQKICTTWLSPTSETG